MTTWEEIREEVAGMLADGKPLEDVLAKLEKRKNEMKKPKLMTNEEWLRSATFEELAGAIYEWHTKGYARGRLEVDLNPITEVVEWLKQPKE